jgi:carnitine O-acetyltransferase
MTTRMKSRSGRAVETTRQPVRARDGDESASTTSREESDGEGGMLGGYGYFDSGSVKHLLDNEVHRKPAEKTASRRVVGRKLRLGEY